MILKDGPCLAGATCLLNQFKKRKLRDLRYQITPCTSGVANQLFPKLCRQRCSVTVWFSYLDWHICLYRFQTILLPQKGTHLTTKYQHLLPHLLPRGLTSPSNTAGRTLVLWLIRTVHDSCCSCSCTGVPLRALVTPCAIRSAKSSPLLDSSSCAGILLFAAPSRARVAAYLCLNCWWAACCSRTLWSMCACMVSSCSGENAKSEGRSILYIFPTQALASVDLIPRSNASMIEKPVHGLETLKMCIITASPGEDVGSGRGKLEVGSDQERRSLPQARLVPEP